MLKNYATYSFQARKSSVQCGTSGARCNLMYIQNPFVLEIIRMRKVLCSAFALSLVLSAASVAFAADSGAIFIKRSAQGATALMEPAKCLMFLRSAALTPRVSPMLT